MDPARVVLAGTWVALMLVYLLGDVLRIFAGDYRAGEMGGEPTQPWMWTLAAVIMLVPIAMLLVCLMVPSIAVVKWMCVVAALLLIVFNAAGLPYDGLYDNLLIVVGFVINALTVWQALAWHAPA